VLVNGTEAGYIGWAPWSLDVSEHLKTGENKVDVIVIGAPKNLFGPHHGGATRGTAWPGMFWNAPSPQGPGENYDTIGYGLFEPFSLILN